MGNSRREAFRAQTLPSSFDIGNSSLSKHHPKKVPPPAPDGREGRLFPPEQSEKLGS
jgi:hypothetical protein